MGHHPATVLHIAFDRNSHQICWDGGPMSQDTSGGSGLLREKRRFMLRYSDFYVTQKERVPETSPPTRLASQRGLVARRINIVADEASCSPRAHLWPGVSIPTCVWQLWLLGWGIRTPVLQF
jgi:hypothetical protein